MGGNRSLCSNQGWQHVGLTEPSFVGEVTAVGVAVCCTVDADVSLGDVVTAGTLTFFQTLLLFNHSVQGVVYKDILLLEI